VTALLVLAAILVAVVAAASIYGANAPKASADGAAFMFGRGRLWASLDGHRTALIDSGTTMSLFPKNWKGLGAAQGSEAVSTLFGRSWLPTHFVDRLSVGGLPFQGRVLVADVRYPIIGSDFLFSRNNVLLTRQGLRFDAVYDPADAIACAGLRVNRGAGSAVASVHLLLNIDGVEREVYFDTGIAPALQASALLPESEKKLFPRMDIRSNALGQSGLAAYFSREATLSLGERRKRIPYRHYHLDRSVGAPFVMGAGILKEYSVLIDLQKGRACFFEAERAA
jgi:hypothetical protein